jgi:PPOX class probable F420-dependent enzyme
MARKDITMTHDEQQAFLGQGHTLIVTTIGKDGWPHAAPMWYFLDAGRVAFRTFTKSQKIVNLQRNSKITVLLEEGADYEELRGIMIKGTARLVTDPAQVLAMYGELSRKYAFVGTEVIPLEGEALEAAFGRFAPKNTGVIVEPESIVSWDHRKLAGAY